MSKVTVYSEKTYTGYMKEIVGGEVWQQGCLLWSACSDEGGSIPVGEVRMDNHLDIWEDGVALAKRYHNSRVNTKEVPQAPRRPKKMVEVDSVVVGATLALSLLVLLFGYGIITIPM